MHALWGERAILVRRIWTWSIVERVAQSGSILGLSMGGSVSHLSSFCAELILKTGYCGNNFGAGSSTVVATQCSFLCPGDPTEYCGAGDRLSVYVAK